MTAVLGNMTSDDLLLHRLEQFRDRVLRRADTASDTPADGKKPGRKLFGEYVPRPSPAQLATRTEARAKVLNAWPDAFARILGPEAANQGTARLFDLFQNATLNKHLAFTLLDAVVRAVVGDAV
ncbi:Intermediate filament protein [Borealophlyctis nickersoniae]|nr:Intermediate filament protein [Borealophlyctis nickersoniae]